MKKYLSFIKESKSDENIEKYIKNNDINSIDKIVKSIDEEELYNYCKITMNYGNIDIFKLLYKNLVEKSSKYQKKEISSNLLKYVSVSPDLSEFKNNDNISKEERENFISNSIILLIEDDADIEISNKYSLRTLVNKGRTDSVKILLEKGCKPNEQMLVGGSNNIDIFRMLVEYGAKPKEYLKPILNELSKNKNCKQVMKYLVDDLKITIDNNDIQDLSDKTSIDFLKYIIVGGVNADFILKRNPNLEDKLKDFEFQKELIDRYPHRIGEFGNILNPKLREDDKVKDIVKLDDWG